MTVPGPHGSRLNSSAGALTMVYLGASPRPTLLSGLLPQRRARPSSSPAPAPLLTAS